MHPSEVASSYNQIAHRWASKEFNAQNGIDAHQRALSFAPNNGYALDVGCGCNGRLIDFMLSAGYTAEGLDLSEEMIRLARIRQPQVTFHHADICTWQPDKSYSLISAWDSIWHVPLTNQAQVLIKLLEALVPGGILLFTAGGLDQPGETQDTHMGVPMYHATLGIPQILDVIHRNNAVCKHLEYDQYPELHIYCIAQKGKIS